MTPSSVETWGDITDGFELLDEELVYVDAPLEGYARHRGTGACFAFRCLEVLPGLVWHWTLIPVATTTAPADEVFASCRGRQVDGWYSVLEDRRAGTTALTAVVLDRMVP